MHELYVEFNFAAAHLLPKHPGKCKNLHGHNYKLAVGLRGEPDAESGLVIDFGDVEDVVNAQVMTKVDHAYLNDFIENPTAEHIATWIWHRLEGKLPGLFEVKLWEIANASVIYRGPAKK
jgi:6-pyruvoyltetrahydropterin/6-carboxytetrahydropterin synthase